MAAELKLKIITPDRIVLEKDVDEVSAHAIDGGFAILKGHEPLVTALAVDVMKYKTDGAETFVSIIGGILEVVNNEVTILTDAAELDTEIDQARALQAKERAEAEKTQRTDKLDIQLSEMALSRAVARLRAAEFGQRRKHRPNG